MNDLDRSLNSKQEAKKFSLGFRMQALMDLIIQRFQALTTISTIAFAVAGIVISLRSDWIHNYVLASLAIFLFILTALVSLGRHLYLIRNDINTISQKIKDLPNEDWDQPLKEKDFEADWWPEVLYLILVLAIILFSFSLLNPVIYAYIQFDNYLIKIWLNILGLISSMMGSIILVFQNLKKTRNVDDDFIVFMNKKTGDYTQKKHIRERWINIIGLILLALGFFFQLLSLLV